MADRSCVIHVTILLGGDSGNACDDVDELRDEVHTTLVHEIAHFYGIDDARLHELGWA